MSKTKTSISTATYDNVYIYPKRRGKADLSIQHEYAGKMAKMHKKNFKKYGDSIISYKPMDEDEFCSFKIQKIKSSYDNIVIKGKGGNCKLLLSIWFDHVSFAWGYDSFNEAEKAAKELLELNTLVDY